MGAGWMEGQEARNGRANKDRIKGLNLLRTCLFRKEIPKSRMPLISPLQRSQDFSVEVGSNLYVTAHSSKKKLPVKRLD